MKKYLLPKGIKRKFKKLIRIYEEGKYDSEKYRREGLRGIGQKKSGSYGTKISRWRLKRNY